MSTFTFYPLENAPQTSSVPYLYYLHLTMSLHFTIYRRTLGIASSAWRPDARTATPRPDKSCHPAASHRTTALAVQAYCTRSTRIRRKGRDNDQDRNPEFPTSSGITTLREIVSIFGHTYGCCVLLRGAACEKNVNHRGCTSTAFRFVWLLCRRWLSHTACTRCVCP